jgi:hypothetical protein
MLKKPVAAEAKPNEMPNQPKEYPYEGMGSGNGGNLDKFAEHAPIKGADQLEHVSVPIDPVHLLGEQAKEGRGMHTDSKMASGPKQENYANEGLRSSLMNNKPGARIKRPKF